MVQTQNKHLLVRADLVLGTGQGGDRRTLNTWRRILAEALPQLMGCKDRCPAGARVRLHKGHGEGKYSAWLRIPIERRPSRRRLRKLKARLRGRLEAGLLPVGGKVLKVGVRRCRPRLHPETIPLPVVVPTPPLALPSVEPETVQSA
jgi:hypothetical protein